MPYEAFIGELMLFAGTYAPRGWLPCQGQTLPINQNEALFSILGVNYGGNGTTTFALPDLRGRAPLGVGQGPGLSPKTLGEVGGYEQVTLTQNQMPQHTHAVAPAASDAQQTTNRPAGSAPAVGGSYGPATGATGQQAMSTPAGGSQPHENRPPYLVLTWCICVEGIFPSRE